MNIKTTAVISTLPVAMMILTFAIVNFIEYNKTGFVPALVVGIIDVISLLSLPVAFHLIWKKT